MLEIWRGSFSVLILDCSLMLTFAKQCSTLLNAVYVVLLRVLARVALPFRSADCLACRSGPPNSQWSRTTKSSRYLVCWLCFKGDLLV